MFLRMRWITLLGLWLVGSLPLAMAVPDAKSVVVLYNTEVAESKKLAEFYSKARGIPEGNLVGLKMPEAQEISRDQYKESILGPLLKTFSDRGWWTLAKDQNGLILPVQNKMRVMVTMRGVPLKIRKTPEPPAKEGEEKQKHPLIGHDEASVDSELAMFGAQGLPLESGLKNAYYKLDKTIEDAKLPFLMLTARIDAPTYETCERMITDAIAVEKTGLWGMAYIDIANKFPQGDQWLEAVVKSSVEAGIPTVVDRFNDTLPMHYPMRNAALYYGWYEWSVNGPFVNPNFRFRQGAVAMHLHSFSAQQMRNPNANWSGALLERGAAATIGNVYEPYLHMTHDFGILHDRLLKGYSFVEACWMAMPVTSWQGVVLGDPLYQPYRHIRGTGEVEDEDVVYRALRAAQIKWPDDAKERRQQLVAAAGRMQSAEIHEALGLELREAGKTGEAKTQFQKALILFKDKADRLRQELHMISIDRQGNRKREAVIGLKAAKQIYKELPEAKAVLGWLDILDPPAPPPADPREVPAKPSNP